MGDATECQLPPQGWSCTRSPGHDGPCAAVEEPFARFWRAEIEGWHCQAREGGSRSARAPGAIGEFALLEPGCPLYLSSGCPRSIPAAVVLWLMAPLLPSSEWPR